MEKISIQSFNAIFDYFNQQLNTVLWITSLDYQRQLYLSTAFEKIWGRNQAELYNNPGNWLNYIHEEDKTRAIVRKEKQVLETVDGHADIFYYRIHDSENRLHFLKAIAFALVDENNQQIGFSGLTHEINQREWEDGFSHSNFPPTEIEKHHKQYLFDILRNELRIHQGPAAKIENNNTVLNNISLPSQFTLPYLTIHNGEKVMLTEREMQCLYYLLLGHSAKKTAALLHISPRTVEFHLNNIRIKSNCRTKIELLSKAKLPTIEEQGRR